MYFATADLAVGTTLTLHDGAEAAIYLITYNNGEHWGSERNAKRETVSTVDPFIEVLYPIPVEDRSRPLLIRATYLTPGQSPFK